MTQHTPTDWHVGPELNGNDEIHDPKYWVRVNSREGTVAWVTGDHTEERNSNAALIVTACNLHDKLVQVLRGLVEQSDAQKKAGDRYLSVSFTAVESIRAILAKAEGR